MKRNILFFAFLISNYLMAQNAIIPQPSNYTQQNGVFKYSHDIQVVASPELENEAKYFMDANRRFTDVVCYINSGIERPIINLELNNKNIHSVDNKAVYFLSVEPGKINLKSNSKKGIFFGLQSILMMFIADDNNEIDCCEIFDVPRFEWRGLMLDESRHFFGKQKVIQLLDYMALLKLNKFHWHLTDVPGWRIEIKQYPKLTEIGSIGNMYDPEAPSNYYSQEDIREVIEYAGERHIEIIPEIDMPGHAAAANRAYPEFSGGGSKRHPEFTFNPASEATFTYLSNILDEVGELFPSKYIHIGGDEVHFGNEQWNHLPEVQKLMKDYNMQSLKEVEEYFVRKVSKKLQQDGKVMIGWDEISGSNVDPDHSMVMWWRHNLPAQLDTALSKGYPAVLCPRLPCYFDFDQHESHQYGRRWSGFSDLESLYNYPCLEDNKMELYNNQILGVQACVWTERIQNEKRLDFMIFPRIFALAEAGWTINKNKSYETFSEKLKNIIPFLYLSGLYYFNPFNPEQTPEPYGRNP